MPRYRVHGRVIGSIYLGEWEANSEAEAMEKAEEDFEGVSFCHQCSDRCEDPQVEPLEATLIEEPAAPTKPRRGKRT